MVRGKKIENSYNYYTISIYSVTTKIGYKTQGNYSSVGLAELRALHHPLCRASRKKDIPDWWIQLSVWASRKRAGF